ncbi:hypothetical protein PSECIP111951_00549 [Pseudoalteromonas holothuriae]|uniref:DUF1826 domain-containing protein n=2 Tax=Pseudoalteromonas holothuriae TaxID=2963714 RepID=A0ABM9GE51_9GAMM|nr:hypothetical protein PSECIP111951_00549 [Pseudoalteromonas sp. CIP111951]
MLGRHTQTLFQAGGINMQVQKSQPSPSWCDDHSPLVLTEIFSPSNSVAIWKREENATVSQYFESAFEALGLGIRGVFSINTLKDAISDMLPDYEGKQKAVNDIYLLSDILTCLFECDAVGLRIAPLTSAMCPSFHIDNIPVRLVHTYVGSGTQWLPVETLYEDVPQNVKGNFTKTNFGRFYDKNHIQQMSAFDVGLLKGKAWQDHEQMAAVHRSCQVQAHEKRVLLTLDPM